MHKFKTKFSSEPDVVFDTNLEDASDLFDAGYEKGKAEGGGNGGGTYLTPEELENIQSIPNKVDKVDGYGLSKLSTDKYGTVFTHDVVMQDGTTQSVSSYTQYAVDEELAMISGQLAGVGMIADGAKRTAEDAKSIALGSAVGYVFDTEADMYAWLDVPDNIDKLGLGVTHFYIRQKDVPDYWWDGTQVQELETQKVDLTEYQEKLTDEQINDINNIGDITERLSEAYPEWDFDETYTLTEEDEKVTTWKRTTDLQGKPIRLSEMQVDFTVPPGANTDVQYLYFHYGTTKESSMRVSEFTYQNASAERHIRVLCFKLRDTFYTIRGHSWNSDDGYGAMSNTNGVRTSLGTFLLNPAPLRGLSFNVKGKAVSAGTIVRIRGKRIQ